MIGRKGQGAMEYLMTYGWAILVVMIVGIVMWQLGIFNMGGTTVTSTGFAKIKPQLAATGIDRNGNANAIFTNGVGTTINFLSGKVSDLNSAGKSCLLAPANFAPASVGAGQNMKLSAANGCIVAGQAAQVYNAQIELTYTVAIGGVTTTHTETGSVRGPME